MSVGVLSFSNYMYKSLLKYKNLTTSPLHTIMANFWNNSGNRCAALYTKQYFKSPSFIQFKFTYSTPTLGDGKT